MKYQFILSTLLFCFNLYAAAPFVPGSKVITPKSYQVDSELSTFTTSAYFDKEGLEEEITEGDAFSMMDIDTNLRYGFGDQLELRAGFRYRQVTAEYTSGADTVSLTNSGLESYWLGAKYALKSKSRWKFAIDTYFRSTSYTNIEYNPTQTPAEEIVLGDSGTEIQIGLHTSYQANKTRFWNTYLAFNMPPNNMSQEIVYMGEAAWRHTKWGFRLGAKGVYSMNNDGFTDAESDKPLQSTANTRMFNSINRSWMTPYVGINYAFDTIRLETSAGQRISGTNTDKGTELIAKLVWNSKGVTQTELKKSRFKEYEVEATIIKISPRKKFVKIDMGISQDVEKGMKIDIFQTDFFGGNVLIASGVVYEAGADWAIVKVLKRFRKIQIKTGFTARGY
jgi:hypothetical protein